MQTYVIAMAVVSPIYVELCVFYTYTHTDQVRASVHTDYGSLTILRLGGEFPGGLQVSSPSLYVYSCVHFFVCQHWTLLVYWPQILMTLRS